GRPGKAEAARLGWTSWGVVSARSTREAAEQISVRGEPGHAQAEAEAGGGRGRTKAGGDPQTTLPTLGRHTSVACAGSHAPTTGQGVGALSGPPGTTRSRRSAAEVGTRCSNGARRGLCGGSPERSNPRRAIPTATRRPSEPRWPRVTRW